MRKVGGRDDLIRMNILAWIRIMAQNSSKPGRFQCQATGFLSFHERLHQEDVKHNSGTDWR